ncbi:Copper amine oxidase N-terminal domain-containing protein [Paenibacillus tianmuensis]|uniref:Copper amine oxidase N-terminal domain-containing protein n=1 Tax=Paenibacillus tianmuensis TaxID=624147 RepID=A0A1G4QUE9_9BACL|nr:copper amine oxidase N-terminal domain-containing protein [Paenibacillus tianmuensis]SCW48283.1 Copper amine oxidase N-terminal domain-containing protein [Paenibacillus tianmuensis]
MNRRSARGLLATQIAPPFGIDLVADAIPEGSVLELAVYNREGQKSGSRSFPITSRISVDVDGKAVPFEQPPVLIEGNTLTPLRAIFEAMGAKVEWDEATRTAIGKKGSTTVTVLSTEQKSPSDTKPGPLQAVGAWLGWVVQQLTKLWNDLI